MKRITTAREYFDMLSPWLIVADLLDNAPRLKEKPVSPNSMVFPVQDKTPKQEPVPAKIIGQPGEPLVGLKGANPESLDPVNDPMGKLNNQRFTFEDMVNNLVSHFNGANEDQRKRGRLWYKKAHDDFAKIAAEAGISPQRAVAVGAAFSPLTDWNINLGHAKQFIKLFRHGDPNFNQNDWTIAHIHPQALQAFRDASGRDPSNSIEDIEALADMHGGLFKSGKTLDGVNDLVNNPKARQRWINNIRHHGMDKVLEDHVGQAYANRLKKDKDGNVVGYNPTLAMRDYGIKTLGNNVGKAKAIMLAREDPELFYELLKGPKVGNFSQNILDDEPMDEEGYYVHPGGDWTQHRDLGGTIDAHHMRASTMTHGAWEKKGYHGDEIDPETGEKINRGLDPTNPFTYSVFNNGLFEATKRINASIEDPRKHLTPKQVQAIIWLKHKEDNDRFKALGVNHESEVTPEVIAAYEKKQQAKALREQRKLQKQQQLVARFWRTAAPIDWNEVEDHVRGQEYPGLTLRNQLGDGPTDGYMVSLPGYEEVRPYTQEAADSASPEKQRGWTSTTPMSAETLKNFNEKIQPVLDEHPDNKQGGWGDDGDWFDDVSRHYTDIWDAAKKAYGDNEDEAQHGFYDVKNGISPSPLEFIHKGEPAFFMARRLWEG